MSVELVCVVTTYNKANSKKIEYLRRIWDVAIILKFGVKCHKGRLHYVMLLDNMPHENVHLSHNMHATDLVYISKYSHCHCESLDMQIMSLACILSET